MILTLGCVGAAVVWALLRTHVSAGLVSVVSAIVVSLPVIAAWMIGRIREHEELNQSIAANATLTPLNDGAASFIANPPQQDILAGPGLADRGGSSGSVEGGDQGAQVPEVSTVANADATRVGVRPILVQTRANDGNRSLPPYVARTRDQDLVLALAESPFVLVLGDAAAGKTRMAYEAAKVAHPERTLVIPASPQGSLRSLADHRLQNAVVWLDNVEQYLGPDGLTTHVLDRLTESGSVVVLATMRASDHARYAPEALRRSERELLERARVVRLERKLDATEQQRAEKVDDPRIKAAVPYLHRYGLAEFLIAVPALVDRYEDGRAGANIEGAAVTRGAIDWVRLRHAPSVPVSTVRRLFGEYFEDRVRPDSPPHAFEAGLEWATEQIYATAALLEREHDGVRPFPYLVDYVESVRHDIIPQAAWDAALADADTRARYDIGVLAWDCGALGPAEKAFRLVLAGQLDWPSLYDAAFNLGIVLVRSGRRRSAEHWFRQAAASGIPEASYNLGILLAARGCTHAAEKWFRNARESDSWTVGVRGAVPVEDPAEPRLLPGSTHRNTPGPPCESKTANPARVRICAGRDFRVGTRRLAADPNSRLEQLDASDNEFLLLDLRERLSHHEFDLPALRQAGPEAEISVDALYSARVLQNVQVPREFQVLGRRLGLLRLLDWEAEDFPRIDLHITQVMSVVLDEWPGALATIVDEVQSFLETYPGRRLMLERDGAILVLEANSSKRQRNLVDAWTRRYEPSDVE